MEILGVGPMELILILIVALLVFGPDKLPEMGAKLGKGLRGMRQATREFSREIEQTRQALEAPMQEVSQPLKNIQASVQEIAPAVGAISHPGEALRQAVLAEFTEKDRPDAKRAEPVSPPPPNEGDGHADAASGPVREEAQEPSSANVNGAEQSLTDEQAMTPGSAPAETLEAHTGNETSARSEGSLASSLDAMFAASRTPPASPDDQPDEIHPDDLDSPAEPATEE
jgi:TatA/E family protein of Tat protein translocase